MVEVFKTDVSNVDDAKFLVDKIHQQFAACKANFDLEDCDLILRIQMNVCIFPVVEIIKLLYEHGFYAEVLEDDFQLISNSIQ